MNPLILPALAFAVLAAIFAFYFGAAKAIALLIASLILAGVLSSLISSDSLQLFLMAVSFGAIFVIAAAGLGIAAGINLKKRRFFLAACLFIPFPLFMWTTHSSSVSAKNEEKLAHDFITENKQLAELVGGSVEVFPSSATTYNDPSRARYEYSIKGKLPLYAIVDVSRISGKSHFRLACVTTLSQGKREAGKDDCLQDAVPLPKN